MAAYLDAHPAPRPSCRILGFAIPILLVCLIYLTACSDPWLRIQNVPENGFERTLNYQFQARVHADSLGTCKMMVVRVKPLNKMYSRGEPPSRLQLFDDDCISPLRFERLQYVSRGGDQVRLFGVEVMRFLSEYDHMESELVGWLWREGVI